jgi:carboxypeptidase Q
VQAYNVVGEIRGSTLPGEVVILGAHQDAWDLASGATDNGTGTVTALEVLRALRALGLKPKRTLRVVLFSGEEQGLLGSAAYVARHRATLADIQAVLVQDAGGGRILGFPDMKVEAWYSALTAALLPASEVGPFDVPYAVSRGSDHDSFFAHGIPAFSPIQDMLDYRSHTQHTELDTIDHVKPADLIQGAQVMAVTAWALLNGPRLPHQPPASGSDLSLWGQTSMALPKGKRAALQAPPA